MSGRDWAARPPGARPWVVGHRGAAGAAAENTLGAFAEAERQGADGVEFDVRACRGGELVVLHDATLARVTGGADARAASGLDAREVAALRLGGGERVPFADEAIGWALGRGLLVNVELKRDAARRARAGAVLAWPGRSRASTFRRRCSFRRSTRRCCSGCGRWRRGRARGCSSRGGAGPAGRSGRSWRGRCTPNGRS